ncbi:alkaline serine protease AorO [Beauveria brongniartii RCEF 3172]|uniref:tripeptidyl-peptidase II n=1 Tax=Beauveria brongniartii RCEF 3172 TaxID=1081107 RepID=A0A162JKQ2_9HYPO|nr:alkaline serine protease AorO [Beauveria brongniartii RCEF 3172]
MKLSSVVASGFIHACFATAWSNFEIHEQRQNVPSEFSKTREGDASAPVNARIALKQNNVESAETLIHELSDPDSPKFGQHLSPDEITNLFASSNETIDSVRQWLIASGISSGSIQISPSRTWVHFNTTVGELGQLLQTQYHEYTSRSSKGVYLGTESYSLPKNISPLVDFILPATSFTQIPRPAVFMNKLQSNVTVDPDSLETCDQNITPKCIRALYGIPVATLKDKSNALGVFETQDMSHSQEDIDQFYRDMKLCIPQGFGPETVSINGGIGPVPQKDAGVEADLDMQIAQPLIYPQKILNYQVKYSYSNTTNFNYIFNDFLDAFSGPFCKDNGDEGSGKQCNKLAIPHVLSISWGVREDPSLVSFHKRQCTEWMKLGLAGTSVFVSSSDTGAQDGNQCYGSRHDIFVPNGVCTCPYITGVGGTLLPEGRKIGDNETASKGYASGGGFSNIFPVPAWQKTAVSNYFSKHAPSYEFYNITDGKVPDSGHGIYNRGGRGFPDISATSENGYTIYRGEYSSGSGTSMATPIVASMFNLINEERLKAGKPSLGFINPALYKLLEKGGFYNDITEGDQFTRLGYNCETIGGFSAVPGWDPVTGVGTPKYGAIRDYFVNL